MAELTPRERLLPCLLDRLTDEHLTAATAGSIAARSGGGEDRFVMSPQQMRLSLRRDLEWLFNTTRKFRAGELEDFPFVAKSVLNYGIPDLCGLTSSGAAAQRQALETELRTAVQTFEPRIIKGLGVRVTPPTEAQPGRLEMEIRGEMWAQPMPESLYFRSAVDLDTGQTTVQDKGHG